MLLLQESSDFVSINLVFCSTDYIFIFRVVALTTQKNTISIVCDII